MNEKSNRTIALSSHTWFFPKRVLIEDAPRPYVGNILSRPILLWVVDTCQLDVFAVWLILTDARIHF
jgi:hypothetical protein